MAVYFDGFPKIEYDVNKDGSRSVVVDILKRFTPLSAVLKRGKIYFDYDVKDGEKPEDVAYKIYGKVDYHWIIMMFNERLDPYFQWPLDYDQFGEYLVGKYGSMEESTQTVHHYEYIWQQRSVRYDGLVIPERSLVCDEETYLTLADFERRVVYNYDWEYNRNEELRHIQILDGAYINQILEEKNRIWK